MIRDSWMTSFIGHDNLQMAIILAVLRVEDLAFFGFRHNSLALPQEFKQWNLAGAEVELLGAIKDVDGKISAFQVSGESFVLVLYFAFRWINCEINLDNVTFSFVVSLILAISTIMGDTLQEVWVSTFCLDDASCLCMFSHVELQVFCHDIWEVEESECEIELLR